MPPKKSLPTIHEQHSEHFLEPRPVPPHLRTRSNPATQEMRRQLIIAASRSIKIERAALAFAREQASPAPRISVANKGK